MEDNNESNDLKVNNENEFINKGILSYDDKEKQSLFRIFGIEMTAPKELKNPRLVYISFIVLNFILLIIIKNLISR